MCFRKKLRGRSSRQFTHGRCVSFDSALHHEMLTVDGMTTEALGYQMRETRDMTTAKEGCIPHGEHNGSMERRSFASQPRQIGHRPSFACSRKCRGSKTRLQPWQRFVLASILESPVTLGPVGPGLAPVTCLCCIVSSGLLSGVVRQVLLERQAAATFPSVQGWYCSKLELTLGHKAVSQLQPAGWDARESLALKTPCYIHSIDSASLQNVYKRRAAIPVATINPTHFLRTCLM